ncbi:MAG: DUF3604 domain-containing protein [SAR324 cluster bacterium]|jgi:hypothetical protein|nr:DUF3604 domain-containing protein [SAR324 cluster bacterium]|tara:strand:- start:1007 stop:3253 length:2247 start_codon:yes stop_codon:yes gene_type:complete
MNSNSIQNRIGSAGISLTESVVAGEPVSFTITYTAGYFGIDDSGSIKICTRFATDMGRPQFTAPEQPNYVSITASNGATLEYRFDPKDNIRPWDKTIYIKIVKGFFREGDQLLVHYGDPIGGSTGIRMQTFCEETFELKVLVDAFATYQYIEVPESPALKIVPGPATKWVAQIPTMRRVNEAFRLLLKAEDRWGNSTYKTDARFRLTSNLTVNGLPQEINLSSQNEGVLLLDGLSVAEKGDLFIQLNDSSGNFVCRSNPLRIVEDAELVPYWGELHGQSEETIGTNSINDYFAFARDKAGLDVIVHQGNDFQITTEFWEKIQLMTKEFLDEGQLVTFPGYEWSGNTGLGGDRNVLFFHEGETIRRSSHALVSDLTDVDTDCNSSEALFKSLKGTETVVFAHVGGRYADIQSHEGNLERSVEIHSAWGTFEWLLQDALRNGYRVGIVSNSDGHKGRPGASYPGASMFGSYGGLTCMLSRQLTREKIWESLLRRHHYGTTGNRMFMDVRVLLSKPGRSFMEDPQLGATEAESTQVGIMGDIIQTTEHEVTLQLEIIASAPIEKLEIRNGLTVLETVRPYKPAELGKRIRVIWAGAEYRGRGRETVWDGAASLAGNTIESVSQVNMYNLEKTVTQLDQSHLEWKAVTTGGFGGFDCVLSDPQAGMLTIETAQVNYTVPVAEIGFEELRIDAGGLDRHLRLVRLPDTNPHLQLSLERKLALNASGDNPLYVCVTQEDGHQAWSSPIYLFNQL